jgi:hypothetical protein
VQFKVDGANYGTAVTIAAGAASVSVVGLTTAAHTFSATYSGDANYAPGTATSVGVTVAVVKAGPPPVVLLKPVLATNRSWSGERTENAHTRCGATPMFAVTVSATSSPAPTGSVKLMEGNRLLSSGRLRNGAGTLTAPGLGSGTHMLTAHYDGDANLPPADSAPLKQAVQGTSGCSTKRDDD